MKQPITGPRSAAEAAELLGQGRGRQDPGRRPNPAADHEAAPCSALRSGRRDPDRRNEGHLRDGGGAPSARRPPMRKSPPSISSNPNCRALRPWPAISATRRSATWERSAALSPTTIRRLTIRPRLWRWARPSSPTSVNFRQKTSSPGCSRPRWTKTRWSAVKFPKVRQKSAYAKYPNPASRYAMAGVFVAQGSDGSVKVAVTGAGQDGVFRMNDMEAALGSNWSADAVSGIAPNADDLLSDLHGSAAYRANLVTVMAKRAVAAAG
jgi:hypothetical protein